MFFNVFVSSFIDLLLYSASFQFSTRWPQFRNIRLRNTKLVGDSRTLTDLVCKINPRRCESFKENYFRRPSESYSPHTVSSIGAPSLAEFQRWNNYEETAQGTGFLRPEAGTNPVPYGEGEFSERFESKEMTEIAELQASETSESTLASAFNIHTEDWESNETSESEWAETDGSEGFQ